MSRFEILLEGYTVGTLTEEELQELVSMIDVNESVLGEKIMADMKENSFDGFTNPAQREKMFRNILEQTDVKRVKHIPPGWMAAASILLLISISAYLYFNKSQKQIVRTETQPGFKNDIPPGGNKAVLTLTDGSQIILDRAKNGTISQQGNTKILKLDNGQLAYNASGTTGEILHNAINTPKGGQYQIVLADGSKVWLNAASSLKFPTAFSGKERQVELTGEAYFEVTHKNEMPFIVKNKDVRVQVLGTHFNVNTYDDETAMRITLLEGSVKVNKGTIASLLKPGQQAQVNTGIEVVNDVDVDEVMAWKNGFFQFNSLEIKEIMRQISRWYDVEVDYKGKINQKRFTGIVSRSSNASEVLKIMEHAGIKFTIEGKKITVMP